MLSASPCIYFISVFCTHFEKQSQTTSACTAQPQFDSRAVRESHLDNGRHKQHTHTHTPHISYIGVTSNIVGGDGHRATTKEPASQRPSFNRSPSVAQSTHIRSLALFDSARARLAASIRLCETQTLFSIRVYWCITSQTHTWSGREVFVYILYSARNAHRLRWIALLLLFCVVLDYAWCAEIARAYGLWLMRA